MQDYAAVTGLILKTEPIGEYDRRVVILTRERGKLSAFARGARKPGSRLMAATNLFCFGEFRLYAGRNAYTISESSISNYFEALRLDFEGAYYGMYFLEVMDYCTRENNDEKELLKLLYQSLRALTAASLGRELVRYIFEIRCVVINGEFPGIPDSRKWLESTSYAVNYIAATPLEKLYTFTVSAEVCSELKILAGFYRTHYLNGRFKSLEILKELSGI